MGCRDYMAIIIEGEDREPQIIENINKVYMKRKNFKIITLPAGKNIYMLWQKLKEDDFQTDIIEILRESSSNIERMLQDISRDEFSEVYLFFDYDGHHDNLRKGIDADVIDEMLSVFSNETENGKLYISYPMVEAIRDFIPVECSVPTGCLCEIKDSGHYKQKSGDNSTYTKISDYDFPTWLLILNVFAMRVSCLFGLKEVIKHDSYKHSVSPHSIYERQKKALSMVTYLCYQHFLNLYWIIINWIFGRLILHISI